MREALLTFVGFHDPYSKSSVDGVELKGPILYLLGLRRFDTIYLFTGPGTASIAAETEKAVSAEFPLSAVEIVNVPVEDPISYAQILSGVRSAFEGIRCRDPEAVFSIATASGTPQMHACWLMLAASGEIPAKVLQARPPQFVTAERQALEETDFRDFPPQGLRRAVDRVAALGKDARPGERQVAQELGMIGRSQRFISALETAAQFAEHDSPVLIHGETGTGKELFARYIHRLSARAARPFVPVNCAALPRELAESLLFGHRKGAFTGALSDQKGKFESADGGTLFLDEIGELSPEVQSKFLRVLEDGIVEPLGASSGRKVDVRVVAATNRDLRKEVEGKRFREDLYYRIEVGTIRLPPLRERKTDIPMIAVCAMDNINTRLRKKKRLSTSTLARLEAGDWPGNVRGLLNLLERSAVVCAKDVLEPEDLRFGEGWESECPPQTASGCRLPEPGEGFRLKEFLEDARCQLMRRALELSRGDKAAAARLLGLTPQAIHNFLRREQGGWREA